MDSTKVLDQFKCFLVENDYSENTIWKYLRDVKSFFLWVGEREVWSAEVLREWKEVLVLRYAPSSVNSMLAAQGLRLCDHCHQIITLDSAFCNKCGSKLEPIVPSSAGGRFCPACGASLAEGDVFCVTCGAKVN